MERLFLGLVALVVLGGTASVHAQAPRCTFSGSGTSFQATLLTPGSQVGCASLFTANYGRYLGSINFAAGASPVVSPTFTAAPAIMELYSPGCTTYRSALDCVAAPTPTTAVPTTVRPTTAVPTTARPTTPVPTTVRPTTPVPTTPIPTTPVPTTPVPTTPVPTTPVPTTVRPTTPVPTTAVPTTPVPTTPVPTTPVPTTPVPTTAVPTTVRPTTPVPTTPVATTPVPTTPIPTTVRPTTAVPTTSAPTTPIPTTARPTTAAPTTLPYNGGAPDHLMRAVFVWGWGDCLVGAYTDPGEYLNYCGHVDVASKRASFFYMLRNPHDLYQPFDRIYLEIDPTRLTTFTSQVQSLIAAAHAQGIDVELLNANQQFASTAALAAQAVQVCAALKSFNEGAPANARFDGIHWDLEPHTLPGWTSNTAAGSDPYNDLYQNNMLSILTGCKNLFAGTGITQAWDVSVFYPRFATDIMTPLLNNRLVDYLAIMNYYNSEALFLNGQSGTGGVVNVLRQLRGQMPTVFIAHAGSDGPATGTWWYQGVLPMENMLGNVGDAYATHGNFTGLAVHDFDAHISLQPYGPPLVPACTVSGTALTISPNGVSVGSVGVYHGNTNAYITHTNVAGPGPYRVIAPRNGPYSVNLWDGPNLSRAALDSLVYKVDCTA